MFSNTNVHDINLYVYADGYQINNFSKLQTHTATCLLLPQHLNDDVLLIIQT